MECINQISTEILNIIAEIEEFKGKWISLKNLAPDRLIIMRKVATVASVGSSTRIEGSRLSDLEVEQVLSRIEKKSFQNRDEEEVAGYAEAMNIIFDSYETIPINENYLKQLHSILLQYSSKDQRHKGEYKKHPNNVEAFDSTGKSIGVIFKTATPFDTPFKMKELIDWYNFSMAEKRLHPLLIIAIFIVHFLAIHPFQDGNGRLSRVLTTLMLLKMGYIYVPYCSLESIVEENKEQYYRALRKAQSALEQDQKELEVWLLFFVKILQKQIKILTDRLDKEKLISLTQLSSLSESILSITYELQKVSVSEFVIRTGKNRNTIKKHLQDLVKNNYLEQHGVGKGTYYTRKR